MLTLALIASYFIQIIPTAFDTKISPDDEFSNSTIIKSIRKEDFMNPPSIHVSTKAQHTLQKMIESNTVSQYNDTNMNTKKQQNKQKIARKVNRKRLNYRKVNHNMINIGAMSASEWWRTEYVKFMKEQQEDKRSQGVQTSLPMQQPLYQHQSPLNFNALYQPYQPYGLMKQRLPQQPYPFVEQRQPQQLYPFMDQHPRQQPYPFIEQRQRQQPYHCMEQRPRQRPYPFMEQRQHQQHYRFREHRQPFPLQQPQEAPQANQSLSTEQIQHQVRMADKMIADLENERVNLQQQQLIHPLQPPKGPRSKELLRILLGGNPNMVMHKENQAPEDTEATLRQPVVHQQNHPFRSAGDHPFQLCSARARFQSKLNHVVAKLNFACHKRPNVFKNNQDFQKYFQYGSRELGSG